MIENITAQALDELIAGGKPVMIDLYATWCNPCKMLAPIFERVEQKAEGRAVFVKVDIDECPELAERYDVQTVPTIVAIKGGEVVHQSHGIMNEPTMTSLLETILA